MNIAYNGLPLEMAAAMIADYYDLNVPPKILIIEATSLIHENSSRDLYLFAALSHRLEKMLGRDLPGRLMREKILHLQTYNRETFMRVLYYLRSSDQNWISRYKITPEIVREAQNMLPITWESRPENVAALKEIMKITDRSSTRLVLMVAPYLPGYVDKIQNFDAWLKNLRAIVSGQARVYDYSRALSDPDYFADRVHLNESGSRRLLDIMSDDGIFDLTASK